MSTTSTKIGEDFETTPTQTKKSRPRAVSMEPKQAAFPGFEALEAVNGLYQKLKDSQAEMAELRQDNIRLVGQAQSCERELESLRSEVEMLKEKAKRAQNKDMVDARKSEDNLNVVLASLRNFSSAAYDLMPLLDVLSDAPDIEYDDNTEKLFQIMKQYKEKNGDHKPKSKSNAFHQSA